MFEKSDQQQPHTYWTNNQKIKTTDLCLLDQSVKKITQN